MRKKILKVWTTSDCKQTLTEISLERVRIWGNTLWYEGSITKSRQLCNIASEAEGQYIINQLEKSIGKIIDFSILKTQYIWFLEDRIKELEKKEKPWHRWV